MKNSISIDEVRFDPDSQVDEVGRLFWFRGNVYRGITKEYSQFYREILESSICEELFKAGMVGTQVAEIELDGYDLILQHDVIQFISYCAEWPSELLKSAALLTCRLSRALHQFNLTIMDAHPWNILFDGAIARFVDWGSLRKRGSSSEWPLVQFLDRFLFPLWLMSVGHDWFARKLMLDNHVPASRIPLSEQVRPVTASGKLKSLLPIPGMRGQSFKGWLRENRLNDEQTDPLVLFQRLESTIERLTFNEPTTEWTTYQGAERTQTIDRPDTWNTKTANVVQQLREAPCGTLLDVGCNRGWYSELAASLGYDVIAADVDEQCLNRLFSKAKTEQLSILPVLFDVCVPTPAHGILGCYPEPNMRWHADVVLALALTHHLAYKRNVGLGQIAATLAAFSKRVLIVEFVPADDEHIREWKLPGYFSEYSLDAFVTSLSSFFQQVTVLESYPPPRKLLVCKKAVE